MSDGKQAFKQTRYIENCIPRSVFDSVVSKICRSAVDAFLGHIEYGKTYAVDTKMEREVQADGFATKCTYMLNFEEIVRCRDCKRFHTNTAELDCLKLDPDGFCAWGERKEP